MKKRSKYQQSPKFEPRIYTRFTLNDLILASIYLIKSKGDVCTLERLVAECFYNFPKVFSFKRYPLWPDAVKFDRPLRTLREKGLIVGNPRDKFALNKYGEARAIDILRKLKRGVIPKNVELMRSPIRSTDDRILEYVKNTPAFIRFLTERERFSISEQEFRSLLRCSLETPERVIKQNLNYYINIAKEYKELDIINFLLCCQRKFFKGESDGKGSSH